MSTIYEAASAVYDGRNREHTVRLLPNGTVPSERTIAKIRSRERGWRYSAAQLERFGAVSLAPDAKRAPGSTSACLC